MKHSGLCAYILLSLVFVFVNLITLDNLPPWIDEVMMLDTSYNAAIHGAWETTAWYRVAGQHPFSTYPPLYQMLAAGWIWLFGSSLVMVRSLNLLIVFLIGYVYLRLMKRNGVQLTPWAVALFTALLWCSSEMAWMYRNGRPDMLCALISMLTIYSISNYLTAKTMLHCLSVIASSALLLCSGFQAAVFLLTLWLFYFVVMKGSRRLALRLLVFQLVGYMLGMLIVTIFMAAHGYLVGFASSIVQYSATLSEMALSVLPWAGKTFGFSSEPYIHKLQDLSTESSLCERITSLVECRNFNILFLLTLSAYVFRYRSRLHRNGFLLLLCALCVPLLMTLAGRYLAYYRWMAFLPLIASIMCIVSSSRLWRGVFSVVVLVLTFSGVRSMLPDERWNYRNLCSFVEQQHFKPSDNVVCPFSIFYEIKPVCDTCYFMGIFPAEYVGRVDYVITATGGDSYDQRIADYLNELTKDTTIMLSDIATCETPSLTLYRVQTPHE